MGRLIYRETRSAKKVLDLSYEISFPGPGKPRHKTIALSRDQNSRDYRINNEKIFPKQARKICSNGKTFPCLGSFLVEFKQDFCC